MSEPELLGEVVWVSPLTERERDTYRRDDKNSFYLRHAFCCAEEFDPASAEIREHVKILEHLRRHRRCA